MVYHFPDARQHDHKFIWLLAWQQCCALHFLKISQNYKFTHFPIFFIVWSDTTNVTLALSGAFPHTDWWIFWMYHLDSLTLNSWATALEVMSKQSNVTCIFPQKAHYNLLVLKNARQHFSPQLRGHIKQWNQTYTHTHTEMHTHAQKKAIEWH